MTGAAALLDDLLARVSSLPEKERKEVEALALDATRNMVWVPNVGPQAEAYFSPADELFYGGQAGGGKTDLGIGLSVTRHKRTLILRRINKDALKIEPRIKEVLGCDGGWSGQYQRFRFDGRQIDIAGCEYEDDKQRFKGDPHDLIVFDEGTDFLESQYRFIVGWNRSSDPEQRCRVLVTSNPPTTAEGFWVVRYWAPWLDPTHPNPAKPGELRWFTTINGEDTEVDGPGPHIIPDEPEPVMARSRTYLPASLDDNPDLARTNYRAVLSSLPEELRRAYRDGDFSAGMKDQDWQVIPTAWVKAAQARWTPDGHKGLAMTAMALDPAGGGQDSAEIAFRYGGWYGELISAKGEETADGSSTAGTVVKHRRDGCPVIVDVGGGYGGGVTVRLRDNNIDRVAFNGATKATGRTRDGSLTFFNMRAKALWTFREALDPDQDGGSDIALPPDPELLADLTAATWKLARSGIQVESKEDIRVRLGRSPGKGDAVVMAWDSGNRAAMRRQTMSGRRPKVVMGYESSRRR